MPLPLPRQLTPAIVGIVQGVPHKAIKKVHSAHKQQAGSRQPLGMHAALQLPTRDCLGLLGLLEGRSHDLNKRCRRREREASRHTVSSPCHLPSPTAGGRPRLLVKRNALLVFWNTTPCVLCAPPHRLGCVGDQGRGSWRAGEKSTVPGGRPATSGYARCLPVPAAAGRRPSC